MENINLGGFKPYFDLHTRIIDSVNKYILDGKSPKLLYYVYFDEYKKVNNELGIFNESRIENNLKDFIKKAKKQRNGIDNIVKDKILSNKDDLIDKAFTEDTMSVLLKHKPTFMNDNEYLSIHKSLQN